MARGINKVILIGNLGRDPETRYSQGGAPVTNFSVATSDSWRDKQSGEQQERTEWHNVVCFSRLAEIAGEYLRKGSKVYIEGSLRTSNWEKDGQKHYTAEVVANEMQMLDSRGETGAVPSTGAPSTGAPSTGAPSAGASGSNSNSGGSAMEDFGPPPADDFDDDIPF